MKRLIHVVIIVALATTSAAYSQICKGTKIEMKFLSTKDSLSFFLITKENPQLWVKNEKKKPLRIVFNDGQVTVVREEVKSGKFSAVCPYKREGK